MVRSILPSKYRTGPRAEKASRKRAHRHEVRVELRSEDPETTAADLLRDVRVIDIVRARRGGDKLNHFMRWCEALTKCMSTEEALGFVRAIVPRSVIGQHAYFHWESHIRPRYTRFVGGPYLPWKERDRRYLQSYHDSAVFRLRRALHLDPALHARLNAAIKARKPIEERRRFLGGLHDVEAFVTDVAPAARYPSPDPHHVERRAMFEHIAEVEKGGRKAALRISEWRRQPVRLSEGVSHNVETGNLTVTLLHWWRTRRPVRSFCG